MTQKEIEEKIKGKLEDSGLTDKDKEQIDNTITNDKINIKNQQDYEKTFQGKKAIVYNDSEGGYTFVYKQ